MNGYSKIPTHISLQDLIDFCVTLENIPVTELEEIESWIKRYAQNDLVFAFYADIVREISFSRWGTP